jgi:ribonuclease BN (tRNA processing enzyme)
MDLTLLATGSPVPIVERGGTALLLSVGDRDVLVDCGQKTVHRLLENETDIGGIEELFFTHQHVDHNADFFHFTISSWGMGRDALTIYGPGGTERLLESLHAIYEEDIEYRKRVGYPERGIDDIQLEVVDGGLVVEDDDLRVTAAPVDHSIETYAYRFEEPDTGRVLVFSGDTRKIPGVAEFAEGADVLVQDACLAPVTDDPPTEGLVWDRLARPYPERRWNELHKTHCTAEEAGEIAADAGVDTLVLTHILPYRDLEYMREAARDAFDGEVVVGRDLLTLALRG